MARRVEYFGDPVLTLAQVAYQCRMEPEDMQSELIEQIVIPGVTGQCESKTGAAIRGAIYEEEWPAHFGSGRPLDVGQANEIVSIEAQQPDGSWADQVVQYELRQGQRESFCISPPDAPRGCCGFDTRHAPTLRLTLACATGCSWLQLQLSATQKCS